MPKYLPHVGLNLHILTPIYKYLNSNSNNRNFGGNLSSFLGKLL